MNDEDTLFQQLVNNDEVPQMIADLRELQAQTSDGLPEDVEGYELAVKFGPEDIPSMLGELEELNNEQER